MLQTQHPWCGPYPSVAPGSLHPSRMVPSASYRIPSYYPPPSKYAPWSSDLVCDGASKDQLRLKQSFAVQRAATSTRQKPTYPYAKFWTSFRELFPSNKRERTSNLDGPPLPHITHDQRRTDGRNAHSAASHGRARHSSIRGTSSATIDRDDPPKTPRRTEDDAQRRTGKPPGGAQPAPHPRPCDWSWPQFTPAQYVRLHPYLQHRCNGPPPIAFDIASGIPMLQPANVSTAPLDPAQLAQPATHPPVRRMHIRSVAEDPLPHVPWPIEVTSTQGIITCGDVLDAITRAFYEWVGEGEFRSWTRHRQGVAARAYYRRVDRPRVVDAGPHPNATTGTYPYRHSRSHFGPHDGADRDADQGPAKPFKDAREGLQRIDYMGDRVIFHGLEQASVFVEDTWFLYVAASERSKL